MGIDNNWARITIINAENFNVLLWGKVTPCIALKFRNILLKFFTSEFLFTYLFILGEPPGPPVIIAALKKKGFLFRTCHREVKKRYFLYEKTKFYYSVVCTYSVAGMQSLIKAFENFFYLSFLFTEGIIESSSRK